MSQDKIYEIWKIEWRDGKDGRLMAYLGNLKVGGGEDIRESLE